MGSRIHITFLILGFMSIGLFGQYNSTSYFMQNLPQSNLLNPANQPQSNFFIGLPGITMEMGNDVLNFDKLFIYSAEIDSFYTPFSKYATTLDKENFLNGFTDKSSIKSAYNINLFSMGFRSEETFFTFHIAQKLNLNIDYPKDLMRLLVKGNGDDGVYDMSGLGGRLTMYKEMALSMSKELNSALTFGVRGKLLFGQIDFSVSDQNILFDFDALNVNVQSQFTLNGSSPFHHIESTDGVVDSIYTDQITTNEIKMLLFGNNNLGFGIDFGVIYNTSDKFSISASVVDLGIISWKNNVFNITNNSNFDFSGIEWSFNNEIEDGDTSTFISNLADSLKNEFQLSTTASPYTSFLTAKIIFGVNFKLIDKVDIGLLSYNEIYRGDVFPRVTLSLNTRPFKFINMSFSYSLLNQEYYNVGFGLFFKPGPLNFYLIGDTFPLVLESRSLPIPTYLKAVRLQFGFNFMLGSTKKGSVDSDMPLWP